MVATASANSHSRCLSARTVPHAGAGRPVTPRSDKGLSAPVYDFAGGERVSYNAYGKQTITSATGAVRPKSAVGWDRGFTGCVADPETGLKYARTRMYSPGSGRFIQRDTAGYVDGYLLYGAYFAPNGMDPMGMDFNSGAGNCRTRQINISHRTDTPIDSGWRTIGSLWGIPIQLRSVLSFYWQVTGSVQECDCCNRQGEAATKTTGQITFSGSSKVDVELGAHGQIFRYFDVFLGGFFTSTNSLQGSGSVILDDCTGDCSLRGTFESQGQFDAGLRGRVTANVSAVSVSGSAQAGLRGAVSFGGDVTCTGPTCRVDGGFNLRGGGVAQYNVSASLWGWSTSYADSASLLWETGRMGVHATFPNFLPCAH